MTTSTAGRGSIPDRYRAGGPAAAVALGVIVGRLDAFVLHEGPSRIGVLENVGHYVRSATNVPVERAKLAGGNEKPQERRIEATMKTPNGGHYVPANDNVPVERAKLAGENEKPPRGAR